MTILYLASIVLANLITARFGPWASVATAFVLIALTITSRDRLHERWHGHGLKWRMAGLIGMGAILSWLINADAGRIAVASVIAFAASETVDTIVYQKLLPKRWMVKVNGSNVASAFVDSFLFPLIAFGGFLPLIVLGQFVAKVFGGWIWSVILRRPALAVAAAILVFAPRAEAQIVSLGAGSATSEAGTDAVVELYAASPPTVLGARLYGIASVPIGNPDDPVFVTAIDAPILRGEWGWTALGPGLVWLPFLDYDPRATLTSTTGLNLYWPGWSAIVIASTQFDDFDDGWSVVVKLNKTLWFRR